MINVRQAKFEEIKMIMDFLRDNWKPDHILAIDRPFFDWMHVDGHKVNYVIGIDEDARKIYGLEGFIMYNSEEHPDGSGALWKTIKSDNPLLGVEIHDYIVKNLGLRYSVGIGLNKTSQKIRKLMNGEDSVARMARYYRLGKKDVFRIASVKNKAWPECRNIESSFTELKTIDEFKTAISVDELKAYVPYKDYAYISHRYYDHPIYSYRFLQLCIDEERVTSVFVVRKVSVGEECAIKIVDYFGDEKYIAESGKAVDSLLEEYGAEYIDLYTHGVDKAIVLEAGFMEGTEDDENVIPNYFEPFEQRNIDVYVGEIEHKGVKVRMFRGDGDMDRPSIRPKI